DGAAAGDKKKRQSRGRRGMIKTEKKQDQHQRVCLSRAPRGKNKYVTVITRLATYDIKLNTTSKFFARSFSCGLSVTGDDEIVIQGNIKDDLFDIISEKWSQ
ncbi:Density-regulated protein, partial [Lamellibrachia satsuma]